MARHRHATSFEGWHSKPYDLPRIGFTRRHSARFVERLRIGAARGPPGARDSIQSGHGFSRAEQSKGTAALAAEVLDSTSLQQSTG